jgi:hypothetical protein
MKSRDFFRCGIFLPVLMAMLMLPSTVSSMSSPFWAGTDDFSKLITQEKAAAFHHYLLNEVNLPALQLPLLLSNNNPDKKYGVIINDESRACEGYTMLSLLGATKMIDGKPINAILIDMQGTIVNTWSLNPVGLCGPVKLLPNGHVMGATPPVTHFGHITEQDWDGNLVWEDTDVMMHHDHQIYKTPVYYTPSAENDQYHKSKKFKVLVLSQDFPNITQTSHISDFPLVDDSYVEVDRDGNELWRWNAWEHFEQFGFDEAAKQAIRNVKVPELPAGDHPEGTDWTHFNSASYLGPNKWYEEGVDRFHPDNIMFNSRSMNLFGIIARHDDRKGKWKSGDIIYRIGPDYSMGQPGHKLGQFIGAHMVHIIPAGLPGAGNILLFANGGYAGFGELVPGSGIGIYPNRYSDCSRVIEFNPITLEIVWEFISPFIDAHPLLKNPNYRAYRVPDSWVPKKHKCR